jgi:cellulose biosynthesis protein BcsQ
VLADLVAIMLAVDLDPQSHLTLSFGQQAKPGYSTGELLNHSLGTAGLASTRS